MAIASTTAKGSRADNTSGVTTVDILHYIDTVGGHIGQVDTAGKSTHLVSFALLLGLYYYLRHRLYYYIQYSTAIGRITIKLDESN